MMCKEGSEQRMGVQIMEEKCRLYVGFINMEKAYDMVNREVLWQVLRMYDDGW